MFNGLKVAAGRQGFAPIPDEPKAGDSSEGSCGERAARAGLQIFLEADGLALGRELDRHHNGPRPVGSRVPTRSCIVPDQPFGDVTRDSDVVAAWVGLASEDVGESLSGALHDPPASRHCSQANY
jgi:hypothetical protein